MFYTNDIKTITKYHISLHIKFISKTSHWQDQREALFLECEHVVKIILLASSSLF